MLKGQDIVILILLRLRPKQGWTYDELSVVTGVSRSQCHLAIQRLRKTRLLVDISSGSGRVSRAKFDEYVIHALKYDFPPEIGAVVRGIPTAHSAGFVAKNFNWGKASQNPESQFVWPSVEGTHKGSGLLPIHPSQLRFAPGKKYSSLAETYQDVYEFMVCIDLLRTGQAREQKWAAEWIRERIHGN